MAVVKIARPKHIDGLPQRDLQRSISDGISMMIDPTGRISRAGADTIVDFPANTRSSELQWEIPSDLIVKAHGHCVGIYGRDLVKIAEGIVDAGGPVILNEISYATSQSGELANKQMIRISVTGPHRGMTLRVRQEGFQLKERTQAVDPEGPWRRWHDGDRSLTYLLDQPKTPAGHSRLIVVFTAIGNPYDFRYNYRSAISDVDAYRLFLLDDFGARGSYYLADHKDRTIYHSVQKFLTTILGDLRINTEDAVFAGSSKGGTAALIHGLPLDIGKIVVGAPQSRPGTYLSYNAPGMLEFISGASDDAGREWLDCAAGELLSGQYSKAQVHILVGDADHHLKAHVMPLEAKLRTSGVSVKTVVVRGVTHQDIGRPFGAYLGRMAGGKRKPGDALIPYKLFWQSGNGKRAQLKLWVPAGEEIAVRAFLGSRLLDARTYSNDDTYEFEVPRGESIRVRIYRRTSSAHRILGAFTTAWLRP